MSAPYIPEDITPVDQEQGYVHEVYNDIASHFSDTRYKPWPIVEKFLLNLPKYSLGIDVGCGNGKYLGVNKDVFIIGTDRSDGLVDCAHKINPRYNLGVADGLNLPHPDNTFDFAISIAVIHHFSTEVRRIEAIQHILSKLKTGGRALIYCWALEQEKSRRGYKEGDDQDVLVPWVLQNKQKKDKPRRKGRMSRGRKKAQKQQKGQEGGEVEEPGEGEEPENKPEDEQEDEQEPEPVTKYRYYHLYKKGELVQNAQRAGNCTLIDEGYERDNWWIVIEKT